MIVIAWIITLATASSDGLDADQFGKLVRGLHARIADVSLVYEGEYHFIGSQGAVAQKHDETFQGLYAYRSDGAMLIDALHRKIRSNNVVGQIDAVKGGKIEQVTRYPDRKRFQSSTKSGGAASLTGPGFPHRLLYTWYFQGLDDPARLGYVFRGWENVDGRRCLHVRLDRIEGFGGDAGETIHFWLDLDRGGHPLRVEKHRGANVAMRLSKVKLASFPAPDGPIWLPVSGECDTFMTEGSVGDPVTHEVYKFVDGSFLLNQDLKDEMLTVQAAVKRRWSVKESAPLRLAREAFESTPERPPLRSDPAGVQERLDAALKVADLQAKELDASASAATEGMSARTISIVAGSLGLVAIGGAAFWAWRRR